MATVHQLHPYCCCFSSSACTVVQFQPVSTLWQLIFDGVVGNPSAMCAVRRQRVPSTQRSRCQSGQNFKSILFGSALVLAHLGDPAAVTVAGFTMSEYTFWFFYDKMWWTSRVCVKSFIVYNLHKRYCKYISVLNYVLFADDTKLFASHKNLDTLINILNKELNKVSNWFKVNKFSLNIKKTRFILFHNKQKLRFFSLL